MTERVLTQRELNRSLLARQLLLERRRLPVRDAIERLCALQAQYSPSPYIALWSRLEGFRKEQLTRALERRQVVKASLMRITLHLVSARDYPYFAAAWLPAARWVPRVPPERTEELARIVHEAAAERPHTYEELVELVRGDLGPYKWRIRTLAPLVHMPPSGTWRVHGRAKLATVEKWLETTLSGREDGAERIVRRYLAAFGPASQADLTRFAGVRVRDVKPGLERLELRRFRNEGGGLLFDLQRAPIPPADTRAPGRFLSRLDAILLAHDDRTRILADEHRPLVFTQNADVFASFLFDGMVAGTWRVERSKDAAMLILTPFAPLPRGARDELEVEGGRLVRWIEDDATTFGIRWRNAS